MNPKVNKAISDTLGLEPLPNSKGALVIKEENLPVATEMNPQSDSVVDEDFTQARENFQNIIEKANTAIDSLILVAQESESPRAYEVLSNLLNTAKEANKDLLTLSKMRREISRLASPIPPKDEPLPIAVNNAVFVGSTKDLASLLKRQQGNVIDVSTEPSSNNSTK